MTAINMVRSGAVLESIEDDEPVAGAEKPDASPDASRGQAEDGDSPNDPASPLKHVNDGNLVIYNSDYVAITDVAKTGMVAVSSHGGVALYGSARRPV